MKLFLACPLRGAHLHAATAMSIVRLCRDPGVTYHLDCSLNEDLSRVRSRLARKFLESDADALLFVDADVSFPRETVAGLIEANKPIVGAPYPKKSTGHLTRDRMLAVTPDNSRAQVLAEPTWWPLGPQDGVFMPALVPMGCTLVQRETVARMTEHYGPDLTFMDIADKAPTVALFHLICGMGPKCETPNLWPEDYSFCMRANAMGFASYVHMGVNAHHHEGTVMFPIQVGGGA